ncbi:MAG: DNA polymerase III subunit delta' [Deltaproteobacteria bacterium]|nr:DNA polymerase III subunit delta' [Deltaproteobacteria bacterium]
MTPFIGFETNWKRLTEEARTGRLPPAYLFYGTPGIGKKLVAQTFAEHLFKCPPLKKGGRGDFPHPDFFLIEPDDAGTIKIDPLRILKKNLTKAPLEAPLKIVLIDGAHEMTPQAANSLLKSLEEPPPLTLFILITPALYAILPTIRSRCRLVFFAPPPVSELAEKLAHAWGLPLDEARHLLAKADGSPGLALRMREESFASAFKMLEDTQKSFASISETAQRLSQKEVDIALVLETAKKGFLRKENGLEAIDKIKRAIGDIERNVNRQLVLENLLMDL